MEGEEWKEVVGLEDYFLVSDKGRLFSKRKGSILKQGTSKKGYRTLSTKIGGKIINRRVHRLVAEAFIPNPEGKTEVNHLNGVKGDNRVDNLEWATPSENTQHAYDFKLIDKDRDSGTNNPASKLTEEDVKRIRALKGVKTSREVGKIYGIHHTNVSRVWRRASYANVK